MAVLDFAGRLETTTCASCGIEFGMPMHFIQKRRENGAEFFCPNGHPLSFRESENLRLKRELAEKDRMLAITREQREASDLRAERTWKTLRQTQGKLNATKKRVGNGVCPCCNRTFKQLARHMGAKHPEYAQPEPEVGEATR